MACNERSGRGDAEAFGFNRFKGLKTKIEKGHAAQFRLLTDWFQNCGEAVDFLSGDRECQPGVRCVYYKLDARGGWRFDIAFSLSNCYQL
ncbi:uncharacterized protein Dmul_33870 [Desulfococcus multivorans]|nr:uncharacterized protein Dmul_33870 [Desulfococcus multivorans]